MALIDRGGRTYYYRSVRRDGRVTSEYLGAGAEARRQASRAEGDRDFRAEMARMDVEYRAALAAHRRSRAAERRRLEDEGIRVGLYWRAVDLLFRRAMEAGGFHLHKRGEWRRARAMKTKGKSGGMVEAGPGPKAVAEAPRLISDPAELGEAFAAALLGDKSAVRAVEATLSAAGRPGGETYLEAFAATDLHKIGRIALRFAIDGWARDATSAESLELRADLMRRELEGDNPTPTERILAERAAFCYMTTYIYEARFALKERAGMSIKVAEYYQRAIDRSHRRMLTALNSLALVRKLARPGVAVRVEQSVNVVTVGTVGGEPGATDLGCGSVATGTGTGSGDGIGGLLAGRGMAGVRN